MTAWIKLAVKDLAKLLKLEHSDLQYNYNEVDNILTLESEDYYIFKNKDLARKFAIQEIETRLKIGNLVLQENFVSKYIKPKFTICESDLDMYNDLSIQDKMYNDVFIFESYKLATDYIAINGVESIASDKREIVLKSKAVAYKI